MGIPAAISLFWGDIKASKAGNGHVTRKCDLLDMVACRQSVIILRQTWPYAGLQHDPAGIMNIFYRNCIPALTIPDRKGTRLWFKVFNLPLSTFHYTNHCRPFFHPETATGANATQVTRPIHVMTGFYKMATIYIRAASRGCEGDHRMPAGFFAQWKISDSNIFRQNKGLLRMAEPVWKLRAVGGFVCFIWMWKIPATGQKIVYRKVSSSASHTTGTLIATKVMNYH